MKRQLDLMAGGAMRLWSGIQPEDYTAVDIEPTSPAVLKADLILEPIPSADDQYDVVTCYDGMEHIPPLLYTPERRTPIIALVNEVWRVLKHDGLFYIQSPCFPSNGSVSDPGHVSFWTEDSVNYYSGDYFGMHHHYGHLSRFEKVENIILPHGHVAITMRAIKNLPPDHPYLLKY
jgi:SAM-dependent methyltransferase